MRGSASQDNARRTNLRTMIVVPKRDFSPGGFTLIELLIVISIIAVLLAFLFPAFQGVQNQGKKTQAKNDLTQIVTAVNAFYTEYGKYPLATAAATQNPRQIVFISPPDVKDPANPRSGIGTATGAGQFFDPWGTAYNIGIDGDYNNQIDPNPYSTNAGSSPLRAGVIAWSLGKDKNGGSGDKKSGTNQDDVISWQ